MAKTTRLQQLLIKDQAFELELAELKDALNRNRVRLIDEIIISDEYESKVDELLEAVRLDNKTILNKAREQRSKEKARKVPIQHSGT